MFQVICKTGSLKTYKRFEAEIYVLRKDEGGRHTAFFSNYQPQFYMRTADITGKVELPENVKMVMPGDNVSAIFELIAPLPLESGNSFTLPKMCLVICPREILQADVFQLLFYIYIFSITGLRFALREGGRTVGAGVVSKVIS